jgi:lysophospholipase L1-like esterase
MVMGLARRTGRAAAITVAAAAVGGAVTLVTEAVVARARRYGRPDPNLAIRTSHGDPSLAPTRLVLLGDSSALGVGVGRVADTVGGRLAELLVADGYRVELSSVAVMGSRSADLATQVARALLGPPPDVAVILVGANDATGLRRPLDAAAALGELAWRIGRPPLLDRGRLAELQSGGFVCAVDRIRDGLGFVATIPIRDGIERTARAYRECGWL